MGWGTDPIVRPAGAPWENDPVATPEQLRALEETERANATVKPYQPGPLERAGRYLGEWGQGIKDAATQPVGGPTGIDLVDAAAGVADFGASAAWDTLTAVPRLATQAFVGARGGTAPPDLFTREPTTPTGRAITDTVGAVFKPAGDALNATGMDPRAAQFAMEAGGAALDVAGLGAAARGAKAGARTARSVPGPVRAPSPVRPDSATDLGPLTGPLANEREALGAVQQVAGTDAPRPGVNPRPFGQSVERARRLDFRVLPSQVAGRAQADAPMGEFGFHHKVPGTFRQGLTATDLVPMAVIDNQKRVNAYAAKELGITEITPQGLAFAKNPHNAVFNEVAQSLPTLRTDWELGNAADAIGAARRTNPLLKTSSAVEEVRDRLLTMEQIPTQKALDAIRSYRQDASRLYRQADMGSGDVVAAEQAAEAYKAAANALEDAIERQAGVLNPDLVPRLKEARTALAKIHNVEDALDGVNVDPQKLVKASDRYPLSGYLKEIADVARDFPDTMKSATGVSLPSQSEVGSIWSPHLFARRHAGRGQGPALLRDEFQNRFGRADPTYDPRPAPPPRAAPPISDYTPPDPNLPGGADVGPPTQGGGGGLAATGLADDFEILQPAEMRVGDLTAETPPMGGSLPGGLADDIVAGPRQDGFDDVPPVQLGGSNIDFLLNGGYDEALGRPAADLGLETPPRDFSAGAGGVLDEGLDFAPDPEMASAPIVRGGPQPGPVADSELLAQELMGAELRGRPLDPETGAGIAPEGVDQPFTRPAAGLGDDFGTDFGAPPRDPLLEDQLGAALGGDFEPGVGPQPRPGFDPYADATDAEIIGMQRPTQSQRPLPPPEDLAGDLVEPQGPPRGGKGGAAADLTLDEGPARAVAPDVTDDGLSVESLPKRKPGDVGVKRTNSPPADMIPRKALPPKPIVYYSGPERNPSRWLVIEDKGDSWQLRSVDTTAFKQENPGYFRPPGRELYVTAARDAAERGKVFNSDTDMSADAVEAIARGVEAGDLIVDDWDNAIKAARAALEAGGGRASRGAKGGEPWFKNIRPGK